MRNYATGSLASKNRAREYRKEWASNNLEKMRIYRYAWNKRNLEKKHAHAAVYKALKEGTMKKENCKVCNDPNTEAHHKDYSKPLQVDWLCRIHHVDEHTKSGTYKKI